jgi:dTDP-4-amino-4,6-dideoxygalactose transaminase
MKERIEQLKNFAILGPEKVGGLGINGKMNEAEAAMGLLQMRYIKRNIEKREKIYNLYVNAFKGMGSVRYLSIPNHVNYNYAYFPIFFARWLSIRDKIHDIFIANNIICRKYWYPLITDHDIYSKCNKHNLVNSRKLSDSVLCLPIYPDLTKSEQNYIIDILIEEVG